MVEAASSAGGSQPGEVVLNPDPAGRPDLQIQADRPLGNGSTLVCDAAPIQPPPTPTITPGGVPAINSSTTDAQYITDALNDFGCRFEVRRLSDDACTQPTPGISAFVNKIGGTVRQYCTHETLKLEMLFPYGDTLLTVRVRDGSGTLGDPKSIVVRVPTPLPTFPPDPTDIPT